jgi:hypothetical protein
LINCTEIGESGVTCPSDGTNLVISGPPVPAGRFVSPRRLGRICPALPPPEGRHLGSCSPWSGWFSCLAARPVPHGLGTGTLRGSRLGPEG